MNMNLSFPEENDPDQFINKAKAIVQREVDMHWPDDEVPYFDVYVVWFSKTLQYWKALLSTSIADGKYYELTYNGAKKETYVDTYVKIVNSRVPDEPTDTNKYESTVEGYNVTLEKLQGSGKPNELRIENDAEIDYRH